MPGSHKAAAALLGLAALLPARLAHADAAANVAGASTKSTDGAVIYQQVCQGCHMANGKGGAGAGVIPALAGNAKLANAGYPIYVVLNGHGGMPWFSSMLDDQQIAAVVGYVRTHFGNHDADAVKPEDVAQQRGPNPTLEK
jgi:mono/diheme cytochrome c family protein